MNPVILFVFIHLGDCILFLYWNSLLDEVSLDGMSRKVFQPIFN